MNKRHIVFSVAYLVIALLWQIKYIVCGNETALILSVMMVIAADMQTLKK